MLEISLHDGQSPNEGYIEIRAFDYPPGGICDDGFRIEEAHVICKMAGKDYVERIAGYLKIRDIMNRFLHKLNEHKPNKQS